MFYRTNTTTDLLHLNAVPSEILVGVLYSHNWDKQYISMQAALEGQKQAVSH